MMTFETESPENCGHRIIKRWKIKTFMRKLKILQQKLLTEKLYNIE